MLPSGLADAQQQTYTGVTAIYTTPDEQEYTPEEEENVKQR